MESSDFGCFREGEDGEEDSGDRKECLRPITSIPSRTRSEGQDRKTNSLYSSRCEIGFENELEELVLAKKSSSKCYKS